MSTYLDGDDLVPYVTDTDLNKYAVLSTATDDVSLRYLPNWVLTVNDAEIYLDNLMHKRKLTEYTEMSEVRKPILRLLGAYLSYKLAFDRIANNPQQNLTDLTYDLYKNKIEMLNGRWQELESDLSDYDFTGVENTEEPSSCVIPLFRR